MLNKYATALVAGTGLAFALACGGGSSVDTFSWEAPSGGTSTCPPMAESSGWPDGARVTLLALHPEDAYAGSMWEDNIPISGTVSGDLHSNDGCWMGGGFVGDDGTDFYFYKAAFKSGG